MTIELLHFAAQIIESENRQRVNQRNLCHIHRVRDQNETRALRVQRDHGIGKTAHRVGNLPVPTGVVEPILIILLQEIVAARPDNEKGLIDVRRRNKIADLPECVIGLRAAMGKVVARIVRETQADGQILHPQRTVRPAAVVM